MFVCCVYGLAIDYYNDGTLFSILQPLVTKELISRLLLSSDDELIDMLKNTISWRFGKVCSWFLCEWALIRVLFVV